MLLLRVWGMFGVFTIRGTAGIIHRPMLAVELHRSLVGGQMVPFREYQTNGFSFAAAIAVPPGMGIDTGIAVSPCGFPGKAILLTDGFSHPLLNTEIDPL
ncbi:MAG TPA: hypothetical protein VF847_01090, partial [Candidatus Deferrimicrobiaceae bacterium]